MPSNLPMKLPILMIPTPKPLLKPADLNLYKTLPPTTPEPKKPMAKPQAVKSSIPVVPAPFHPVLSEQEEFESFVKNNLKGLNPNVKPDRLKKMMNCYREHFYRDVPMMPMQTEHHFYDYLIKMHFPELMHYLGLTTVAPQNFPAKSDKPEYYLKIEKIILPLTKALGFKEIETFKKNLGVSSFQKGLGDYLTNNHSSQDQKIIYVLTKGKEYISFRSEPGSVLDTAKPALPIVSAELTVEEKRKALIFYIRHYFAGKEKESFLKEIKYMINDKRINLLWKQFVVSIEKRAESEGKEKYLYFEPIVCDRISSKAGWRRDPLKSKRKKIVLNFHKGSDLPAPEGTSVFNPYPGKVIWVSHDEETGAGKSVHILHKNGLITRYKHLSKINVVLGDEVPLGRIVAESGDTGIRTTGPHLHYEIIDPEREYAYKFKAKIKKLVGYKTKKVKKNNRWVKVKSPVFKASTLKRSSVAHIAPIHKKTLFVHQNANLSAKQLKTNADNLYAKYMQNLLAAK